MKKYGAILTALACLLLVIVPAGKAYALQGPDNAKVILVNKKTGGPGQTFENCRVVVDHIDEVRFSNPQFRGRGVEYKTSEIYDIIPTGANSLAIGVQKYQEGNYEDALKNIESAASALSDKDWGEVYTTYYKGLCLIAMGGANTVKGISELKNFETKRTWRNSRLVPHAIYHIAVANQETGKYKAAEEAFKSLSTDRRFSEKWKFRGRIGLGEVKFEQKNWDDARRIFEQIQREAKSARNQSLENKASVYIGKCYAAGNNWEKAKKIFDGILEQDSRDLSKEVKAAAHNGLGDYYKNKGSDKENTKEALLHYLRVATLYSVVRAEYAKALYMAAKCFEALGQKPRATRLINELKKRCPGSSWARKR